MLELVIRPMADAFMQVGVFVALLAVPFGWARYRWGDRFDAALARHRKLGPLVAALLTVPPGCGGAIIVMAVYARGAVSYGAAVSALVATMGDASWVLLAAEPLLTLELKVLLVLTGTATGYAVDLLGVAPALRRDRQDKAPDAGPVGRGAGAKDPASRTADGGARAGTPAAVAELRLTRSGPAGAVVAVETPLGALPMALWAFLACGLMLSLPVTFQLLDPAAAGRSFLAGVDPYLVLGAVGTALCVVAFVRGGCTLADDDEDTARPASMGVVLRHGAAEIAFVTVWVAAVYVSWALVSALTGFDGSQLPVHGLLGVVVGALVGLIPGCAIQIVFTGIFLAGGMPLSTLAANSASQDGDALIPLLALERPSALLATVITTLPALVLGAGILVLG